MKRSTKIQTIGVGAASRIVGVSYATALRLAKHGELPCVKLGRQYLILKQPFMEMLQRPSPKIDGENA